jgi:hypothetical protein
MELTNKKENQRLGITFHRTFSLNAPAIRQILKILSDRNLKKGISRKKLEENSDLGSIYLESMPRWAWVVE